MQRINQSQLEGRPRPSERVIQFGEGNFLRAFMDWKIDRMNEATGSDFGIVVVRPIDGGIPHSLNDSDGVYTVLSRGVGSDGKAVSESRAIAAVRREMSAVADWNDVLALAHNPDISVVISNTTEAGITYSPDCQRDDAPPATFPAKVTRLLMERFESLGGSEAPGFQFLPCELIDHNADELKRCVLAYADQWQLGADFIDWVHNANAFYNTLVDRIVPGFPRDEINEIEQSLGYHDPLLVTAELFHFLVIEQREGQPDLKIPIAEADEGTIIVPNADGYKERKVAILNGAHTGLCPLALLGNSLAVRETMQSAPAKAFLRAMLEREILPYLSLPREELEAFSAEVLRRFENPFILHRWHDISLNGIAKFHTRNLPRFKACWQATGAPSRLMSLSLAAWLVFYQGDFAGSETLPPRDDLEVIDHFDVFKQIGEQDGRKAMIRAYLTEESFWGESLASDDLVAMVTEAHAFLTNHPFTLDRLDAWSTSNPSA
ncbi:tagaturonate reductase [Cohaesibacter intestini]|uniref:tagaturonate reductase n=1 Tax=Cohaesibacter intestini TaxID=2211145 RepID=UPI000DE858EC|nr:tagaturonate reductase [Cohaesibacter intestini]